MKAIRLGVYGTIEVLKDTTLTGLQKSVGGYVEAVYLRIMPFQYMGKKYDIMLVNEDGLTLSLDINTQATLLYAKNTNLNNNVIVGDVVFTTNEVWN